MPKIVIDKQNNQTFSFSSSRVTRNENLRLPATAIVREKWKRLGAISQVAISNSFIDLAISYSVTRDRNITNATLCFRDHPAFIVPSIINLEQIACSCTLTRDMREVQLLRNNIRYGIFHGIYTLYILISERDIYIPRVGESEDINGTCYFARNFRSPRAPRDLLSQTGRSRKFQRYVILTETVVAAGGQVFRRVMRTTPPFAGPERLDFRP